VQAKGQRQEHGKHEVSHEAVHIVNGGERLEADVGAVMARAQFAPQREALAEVHGRPHRALASRKVGAGQHRVVGADPAAQGDLDPEQRKSRHDGKPQAGGKSGGVCTLRLRIPHSLRTQQCQQHQAAQQVQRDDGGEQLHRDGQRAERALQTYPDQGDGGPPGRHDDALALQPAGHGEREDQHPDAGGQVAVDHFDPGLGMRDGSGRHGGLRGLDMHLGAHRAGAAVATGPVGATQPRIGEPGESAEDHQVKGEEQRNQRQHPQALRPQRILVVHPHPGQRRERDRQAHDHQAQGGAQVVEVLRCHV
jgi:hypothetical protein